MKGSKIILNIILIIIFVIVMYFVLQYFSAEKIQQEQVIDNETESIKIDSEDLQAQVLMVEDNEMEQEIKKVNIEVLQEGMGEESKAGDTLSVHYTGTFENGEKFDSSVDRGDPFEFTLGQGAVIQGWEQGMLGMKQGEKRKLFIPYELGYGEAGYGPIPEKSNLIFEVELLEIK